MEKSKPIRWTEKGKASFGWTIDQFRHKISLQYAEKAGRKILARIEQLQKFPEMGPLDPILESLQMNHRSLLVREYHLKIIYRITADSVIILHITDARQNPDKLRTANS